MVLLLLLLSIVIINFILQEHKSNYFTWIIIVNTVCLFAGMVARGLHCCLTARKFLVPVLAEAGAHAFCRKFACSPCIAVGFLDAVVSPTSQEEMQFKGSDTPSGRSAVS